MTNITQFYYHPEQLATNFQMNCMISMKTNKKTRRRRHETKTIAKRCN